ncbi:Fis family transcriptional regulator [Desulfonema ishimotonii]|uniref:HTH-type transcriptional regulatory protein TyrR n=1 Tax=Desulfonema ishimotonii TaxID=45657 RepID=A0A401G119_9BACT|nr:sigma 54-interacting transcriptional regulator [Desulfonema ishimotonii]GBC62901.1 Fis family transcriptional regulator [Desulfonema ishimotonii]
MTLTIEQPFLSAFLEKRGMPDWRTLIRILLDATPSGILFIDEKSVVVFSNRAAQDSLKLGTGTQVKERFPDLWTEVRHTLKDRNCRFDLLIRKEGKVFPVKLSPVIWKNGVVGVLCMVEDRTEMKKITRKMLSYQELNRELDTIIDTSSDGLWICDANATVVHINPASERINGVRASDVVGRNMGDLVAEGLVDQSVTLEVIEKKSVVNLLQHLRNGQKLILTGNPVFDESGNLIRVVVNERDITEIDRLHRELEEQAAIKEQMHHHMLERQLEELESSRIIAKSPCFINVLKQALKVSAVESTVLLSGESGSGKGMIAKLIHKYSSRSQLPMIELNCGAIPETLVEAELFGYEKGAFTGADIRGKPGYFELADGGTLFLDEIGELPLSSQVKLLRFLEDGHVIRVGGTLRRKVDVRVLAATNRRLKEMVNQGDFRMDLYYRLHVIPLRIPPLRDRTDCILPLIYHYVDHFGRKLGFKKRILFTHDATHALLAYSWPGNVRELMNLCERLVVMTEEERVDVEHLPGTLALRSEADALPREVWQAELPLAKILEAVEKKVLNRAMEKYRSQTKAADALGVNQSTIARKLKKYAEQRRQGPLTGHFSNT